MAGFTVPGFDLDRLLSRGWGGELWSARGRATGRRVVLRRLAVSDDIASHDRVRRAAARLVGVQHEHLVGLRGVLSVEGAVVLVHDHVEGIGLDALLAGRRSLEASEVVTLLVPLARALAELHACGLVHGRVSPASVLLGDDGRPMLADTGVAALIDGGARPTSPSDDVRDLALTGRTALGPGGDGASLRLALSAAADGDAARRPSASAFAAAVFATGRPAPIPAVAAEQGSRPGGPGCAAVEPHANRSPRSPRSRRSHGMHRRTSPGSSLHARRRWATLLVALVAGAAAAFGGLAWAGVDHEPRGSNVARGAPSPAYDETATASRWRSVLAGLDARRASAFAAVNPGRLAAVYTTDSPALRRDQTRLSELASAGLHVERLRLRSRSVRVLTSSPTRVVLAVVDALESYDVRTTRGALVTARPGRAAASWQVTLVRSGGDWRVYDVVAG